MIDVGDTEDTWTGTPACYRLRMCHILHARRRARGYQIIDICGVVTLVVAIQRLCLRLLAHDAPPEKCLKYGESRMPQEIGQIGT